VSPDVQAARHRAFAHGPAADKNKARDNLADIDEPHGPDRGNSGRRDSGGHVARKKQCGLL
jgi:hypothetical protein